MQSSLTAPPAARAYFSLWMGAFLLVLGVRLAVVNLCGIAVPYVDEWTAIGRDLLLPFQQGTLEWRSLFANHNAEHCIFATRLIEIALFQLNGQWDPLVGMVVNAVLAAATVALWIGVAMPGEGDRRSAATAALFLATLWALPFDYANLLWAFQSQMFLLLLSTVLALREVSMRRVRLWVIAVALLAAVLSNGGGFVTAIIVGAVLVVRLAMRDLSWGEALGALAVVLTAGALALSLRGADPGMSPTGAFLLTFAKGASWPNSNLILLMTGDAAASRYLPAWMRGSGSAQAWAGMFGPLSGLWIVVFGMIAAISWTPFSARCLALWRRGQKVAPPDVFHLALGCWVLAILAAIALKRSTDYFVPTRYVDLILPGLAVNGWIVLRFHWDDTPTGSAFSRWLRRIWVVVVGGGLAVTIAGVVTTQLPRKAAEGGAWMRHLSGYAQHQNASRLENLEPGQLPLLWPNPWPLIDILHIPGFRALLVPELRAEPPRHGPLGVVSRFLLSAGPLLVIAGLLLLARARWRRCEN